MSEDERPTLKLSVEKGPLSGCLQEFKPGTRIQIGRVRGNTLIIKDAGVSSKHLALQFDSGSGKWTLTDLNSSNGTFLNSELIEPAVPCPLSDGDVIKIGELTAIEVKVNQNVEVEEKREEDSRPRRNPRRQARRAVTDKQLGVIDENREVGLGLELGVDESVVERNGGGKGGRRRGRPPKNDAKKSGEQGEEFKNFEGNSVKSTTRSSKGAQHLGDDEERWNLPVGKVNPSRTRRSKKEDDLENCKEIGVGIGGKATSSRTESLNVVEDSKGMCNEVVGRVGSRRTRSAKEEEMLENGREDVAPAEEKKGHVMNLRRTRSSTRKAGNLAETQPEGAEVEDLNVVEGRRTIKDLRMKRNLVVEASESVDIAGTREGETVENLNLGEGCEVDSGNISRAESHEMEKKDENLGREGVDGTAGTSGVKENGVVVDLEKMTLGEWFDYLEEYLPKQIINKTEDMILGMRQKAEKFHEFMCAAGGKG